MTREISSGDGTKVVQTELPSALYERFKAVARERGLSIKEATAEAITEFTHRYQPTDPNDPLFAPLDWDDEVIEMDDDASERVDDIAYGSVDAEST